jgi:hypothetical protein
MSVTLVGATNGFTNEPTKAGSQRNIDELVAITESLRAGLLASSRSEDDRFKMRAAGLTKLEKVGSVEGQSDLERYRLTFGTATCVMNVDVRSGWTTPAEDVMIVAASGCDGGEPHPTKKAD